jgi:hypothetical protein
MKNVFLLFKNIHVFHKKLFMFTKQNACLLPKKCQSIIEQNLYVLKWLSIILNRINPLNKLKTGKSICK